jgi:hypothetical protein
MIDDDAVLREAVATKGASGGSTVPLANLVFLRGQQESGWFYK